MTDSKDSWSAAPENLTIGEDEVHVWRASLKLSPSELYKMKQNLFPDEQERAERFYFQKDREHFIAAHGILREILSGYLEKDPYQLVFKYNFFGKPFLAKETGSEELLFNLSHSHGTALYAFTQKRKVGIDLEYIRSDMVKNNTAEQTFSSREVTVLRSLPEKDQVRGFFNCWTRKEAYIKAKGQGMLIPLDQFEVSLTPGEPVRLLNTEWDANEASLWRLMELNVGTGYTAAIAVEGHDWYLKFWEWAGNQEKIKK